ncbi:hypothetical protein DWB90_09285 [Staphylococcus chromogenes]|nr:hypothetical protein DWB90_09015 [Staphylococcus chromogenes]QDX01217.1 hypothetical protein DWB90_09285 [Staphylococcus chromogenes]
MKPQYLTIKHIMRIAGVSRSKATSIVREMNQELEKEGYITVSGKVPVQLVREKMPYWDLSDEVVEGLHAS